MRARNNTTTGWENKQEAGPGPGWFSILQLSNDHVHPAMSERAEEEDEIPRLTTTHRIDEMDGNTEGRGRGRGGRASKFENKRFGKGRVGADEPPSILEKLCHPAIEPSSQPSLLFLLQGSSRKASRPSRC